ncbi:hypothetical protein WX45_00708 [Clostridium ljungdahlii DSM 13528]|uniref:Transposase n=1 Tax=Clostridium ljungdahlii (strain ATCC 55383 / DSM 13528 / PETC) TaxID=748727 RepID=A0ABX2TQR3_CLOLD|nr:Hypothetical protein CLAU_1804 [Clostridium autoethanogenum DSM 10061]OAA85204.1 hypothetical protein WX45_00708 [Clostridium ljungdahlii DSM 13528]OVY48794.1 hypothetical protein WX72_00183 [Clostridium autoethanogenum]
MVTILKNIHKLNVDYENCMEGAFCLMKNKIYYFGQV